MLLLPILNRLETSGDIFSLRGRLRNIGAEFKEIPEEVISHFDASKFHSIRITKGLTDLKSELMPPDLSLIERIDESKAVYRVLIIISSLIIHCCLHHIKSKLPILLELQVSQGRLLIEESNYHGSSLNLTRYLLVVEST